MEQNWEKQAGHLVSHMSRLNASTYLQSMHAVICSQWIVVHLVVFFMQRAIPNGESDDLIESNEKNGISSLERNCKYRWYVARNIVWMWILRSNKSCFEKNRAVDLYDLYCCLNFLLLSAECWVLSAECWVLRCCKEYRFWCEFWAAIRAVLKKIA